MPGPVLGHSPLLHEDSQEVVGDRSSYVIATGDSIIIIIINIAFVTKFLSYLARIHWLIFMFIVMHYDSEMIYDAVNII